MVYIPDIKIVITYKKIKVSLTKWDDKEEKDVQIKTKA